MEMFSWSALNRYSPDGDTVFAIHRRKYCETDQNLLFIDIHSCIVSPLADFLT